MNVEVFERPLPKPTAEDYVSAKLLESLMETRLSPEFLNVCPILNLLVNYPYPQSST